METKKIAGLIFAAALATAAIWLALSPIAGRTVDETTGMTIPEEAMFSGAPSAETDGIFDISFTYDDAKPPVTAQGRMWQPIRWTLRVFPNNLKRFFLVNYSAFLCFSVGFRYSLGIYKSAFHRCSGSVCGHLCGQKRFPPQTGDFPPAQDRKRFHVFVCRIVTLSRRLCKSFLRDRQLKVCDAINKE